MSRINPIPRTAAYFFRTHSNLSSHLPLGLHIGLFTVGVPVKILKTLSPFQFWLHDLPSSRFNHANHVRWTVQTIKFLLAGPSPFLILIPLGAKYSPQDPVF